MDDNLTKTIRYNFPQGYRVVWLEELLEEFDIEYKLTWSKLSDFKDDWLYTPEVIFKEPHYPEFYSISYTYFPKINNPHHDFADALTESMMSYTGYLEGCLQKEKKRSNYEN